MKRGKFGGGFEAFAVAAEGAHGADAVGFAGAEREFIARDDQDQPYTQYFVTFETGDGERVELEIPAAQYGYMVERDRGSLRYEESRFISFDRK